MKPKIIDRGIGRQILTYLVLKIGVEISAVFAFFAYTGTVAFGFSFVIDILYLVVSWKKIIYKKYLIAINFLIPLTLFSFNFTNDYSVRHPSMFITLITIVLLNFVTLYFEAKKASTAYSLYFLLISLFYSISMVMPPATLTWPDLIFNHIIPLIF